MRGKDEVYAQLRSFLIDLFEVPEGDIVPDARLAEDLDLDSIDAVDLIVKFQELTGQKIPATAFKSVRTVGDVVEKIHAVVGD
ncbi:MAG: acyl carrier protein [Rhodospirillum sp.]|nr:acyl carrier protein [Rhodospirillum sp.]MCF8490838.1 acyl carrier protein [Rhodospirillum sp.]MCF8501397.1 acyl carrier protein [Rhodospirillum sp.]